MINARTSRKSARDDGDQHGIVERHYQHVRSAASVRHSTNDRQAEGAPGDGDRGRQDPHVIALIDLLMRAGWVKRALFLADRLPSSTRRSMCSRHTCPIVSDREPGDRKAREDGRVYVSTYPTMMGLIDDDRRWRAPIRAGVL